MAAAATTKKATTTTTTTAKKADHPTVRIYTYTYIDTTRPMNYLYSLIFIFNKSTLYHLLL
jgi:hypothetical protein